MDTKLKIIEHTGRTSAITEFAIGEEEIIDGRKVHRASFKAPFTAPNRFDPGTRAKIVQEDDDTPVHTFYVEVSEMNFEQSSPFYAVKGLAY